MPHPAIPVYPHLAPIVDCHLGNRWVLQVQAQHTEALQFCHGPAVYPLTRSMVEQRGESVQAHVDVVGELSPACSVVEHVREVQVFTDVLAHGRYQRPLL